MLAERPGQEERGPPGDRLLGKPARAVVNLEAAQAALVPAGLSLGQRESAELQEVRRRAGAHAAAGVQHLELLLQRESLPEDEDALAVRRRDHGRGCRGPGPRRGAPRSASATQVPRAGARNALPGDLETARHTRKHQEEGADTGDLGLGGFFVIFEK